MKPAFKKIIWCTDCTKHRTEHFTGNKERIGSAKALCQWRSTPWVPKQSVSVPTCWLRDLTSKLNGSLVGPIDQFLHKTIHADFFLPRQTRLVSCGRWWQQPLLWATKHVSFLRVPRSIHWQGRTRKQGMKLLRTMGQLHGVSSTAAASAATTACHRRAR